MIRSALVYPCQVKDGRLVTTDSYPELVRQAIIHTINTKLGELVWTPEYGTGYLVLDQTAPEVLRQLREAVEFTLLSYPQVSFKLFAQPSDTGQFNVVIAYETPESLTEELKLVIR